MLDGRPSANGEWSAKCPAHDDTKRSLSLTAGGRQRIIWHCHAGCTAGEVKRAMLATRKIAPRCIPWNPSRAGGQMDQATRDRQQLAEIEKLLGEQPNPVDFMIRVAELLHGVDERAAAEIAGIPQATYYRHRAKRRK